MSIHNDGNLAAILEQARHCAPLLEEMRGLYRRLEQELAEAGPVCRACGRCCDFPAFGHRLYASGAEMALLVSTPAPQPGAMEAGLCPYQVEGRCEARENRPLGCRVFFCESPQFWRIDTACETYHGVIREFHEKYCIPYVYADARTWLSVLIL